MIFAKFFLDIDECEEGSHNCMDLCVNLQGGFECACRQGYTLINSTSCAGMYLHYTCTKTVIAILFISKSACMLMQCVKVNIYFTLKISTSVII